MHIKKTLLIAATFTKRQVIPALLSIEEQLAQHALSLGKIGYSRVNKPVRQQAYSAWQYLPQTQREQAVSVQKKVVSSGVWMGKTLIMLPYHWLSHQVKALGLGVYNLSPEVMKKPLEERFKQSQVFFSSLKPDVATEKIALDALQVYLDTPESANPKRTDLVMLGKKISDYKRLSTLSFLGCTLPIPFTYLAEMGALMPPAVFLKSPLNNPLLAPLVEQTKKNFLGTVLLGEALEWIFPFVSIPFSMRRKHLSGSVEKLLASESFVKESEIAPALPLNVLPPVVISGLNPPFGVGGLPRTTQLLQRWISLSSASQPPSVSSPLVASWFAQS
jgi:hypothetical protein